jgi:hypothetical protein
MVYLVIIMSESKLCKLRGNLQAYTHSGGLVNIVQIKIINITGCTVYSCL